MRVRRGKRVPKHRCHSSRYVPYSIRPLRGISQTPTSHSQSPQKAQAYGAAERAKPERCSPVVPSICVFAVKNISVSPLARSRRRHSRRGVARKRRHSAKLPRQQPPFPKERLAHGQVPLCVVRPSAVFGNEAGFPLCTVMHALWLGRVDACKRN